MSALAISADLLGKNLGHDDLDALDDERDLLQDTDSVTTPHTATVSHFKNHVGTVVDRFWEIIPTNHRAFKINPMSMPLPHEHLHALGNEVIKACLEKGYHFEDRLAKQVDRDAWMRLLGAWVFYTRSRIKVSGGLPARFTIAKEMGIDASSLTNFLNARRPVTLKALKVMAQFLGVKPLDIRPEMGASELYSQDRKIKKSLISIRSGLDDILRDVQRIHAQAGIEDLGALELKIKALKDSAAF